MTTDTKLEIYSPWVILSKQIEALFEKDPEVEVKFDNDTATISLYVENSKKGDWNSIFDHNSFLSLAR